MSSGSGVELDPIPTTADDLEDYAAAIFQASGYYVEKNLVEREPADVLELDVVATDFSENPSRSILGEVKGGGWGYSDAFKVFGWMKYLNTSRSVLLVTRNNGDTADRVNARLGPHGLNVVCFDDFTDIPGKFEQVGLASFSAAEHLVHHWRVSYGIERKLMRYLQDRARSEEKLRAPAAALEYYRLVNNVVFFADSNIDRLKLLYAAYQSEPQLTLWAASELEGTPTAATAGHSRLLMEALSTGKHPLLQACMYVQHRARLALLRAGVEICSEVERIYGKEPTPSQWKTMGLDDIPGSFCTALSWLIKQPTYRRYALLWQQYLWGLGGIIIDHFKDKDYALLSEISDVPADEIYPALYAFDMFFPVAKKWHRSIYRDDPVHAVLLVPTYFRGLGVHYRTSKYGWSKNLREGPLENGVADVLRVWGNSSVEYLNGSL